MSSLRSSVDNHAGVCFPLGIEILYPLSCKVDLPLPGDQGEENKYPNFFGENGVDLPGKAEEEKYPNYFGKRVDAVPAKAGM